MARSSLILYPAPQSHPEVIEAARTGLTKYGAGLSSVRFICGTQVCDAIGINTSWFPAARCLLRVYASTDASFVLHGMLECTHTQCNHTFQGESTLWYKGVLYDYMDACMPRGMLCVCDVCVCGISPEILTLTHHREQLPTAYVCLMMPIFVNLIPLRNMFTFCIFDTSCACQFYFISSTFLSSP